MGKHTVLQWLFKLNSAATIAEMWELKGRTPKFKTHVQTNDIKQSDTHTL